MTDYPRGDRSERSRRSWSDDSDSPRRSLNPGSAGSGRGQRDDRRGGSSYAQRDDRRGGFERRDDRPRREDDRRSGGFERRDNNDRRDDRRTSGYGSRDNDRRGGYERRDDRPRRDDDRRSGGFERRDNNDRRDGFGQRDDRRTGGYRSRDNDRRGGYDRPRREDDRRSGGFERRDNNDRRDGFGQRDDRRTGGYGSRDNDRRGGYERRDDRPRRDNDRRGGSSYAQRDDRRGGFERRDDRPRREDDRRSGGFERRDNNDRRDDRRTSGYGSRDNDRRGGYERRDDRPRRDDDRRSGGFERRDNNDRRDSFGQRDDRRTSSYGSRDNDRRGGYERRDDRPRRDDSEPRTYRPGLAPKENEPKTPNDVTMAELPRAMKAELKSLPSDLALEVASHLVYAGELLDIDPQKAYAHAEAARRRASRLPIVREATAEAAYAAGEFAVALNEYRTLRRMTGQDSYLAVMADCERALGKPQAALDLAREGATARLDLATRVELRIVEAGAREDLGQIGEAMRLLKAGMIDFDKAPTLSKARLRVAFGEALLRQGNEGQAILLLQDAVTLDPSGESGAEAALDELIGISFEIDLSDDDDEELVDDDGDILPDSTEPVAAEAEEAGESAGIEEHNALDAADEAAEETDPE